MDGLVKIIEISWFNVVKLEWLRDLRSGHEVFRDDIKKFCVVLECF
jgi:hypothetical protein